MYTSEEQLVSRGRKLIRSLVLENGLDLKARSEVKAPGTIPDLVLYLGDRKSLSYVIALEFKLRNWRQALTQAFKHKNFVNESYVVLDHAVAAAALSAIGTFRSANVGLITIDKEQGFSVWHLPIPGLPFSKEFSTTFARSLLRTKDSPEQMPYLRNIRGGARLAELRQNLKPKVIHDRPCSFAVRPT